MSGRQWIYFWGLGALGVLIIAVALVSVRQRPFRSRVGQLTQVHVCDRHGGHHSAISGTTGYGQRPSSAVCADGTAWFWDPSYLDPGAAP